MLRVGLGDVHSVKVLAFESLETTSISLLIWSELCEALMAGTFEIVETLDTMEFRTDERVHDDESDWVLHHLELNFVDA